MMAIAFGTVIYSIKELRSPDFERKAMEPDNALAVLIGSDYRPYAWCPKGTEKIDIYANSGEVLKTLTSPADISALCEIMMGAVSATDINEAKFVQRLGATSSDKTSVIMEQIPGKALFRVKGMSFSSPMLVKALERQQAQ